MRASDFTPGEKLFLTRKRKGQTMATAAKSHKVSLFVYRGWENDDSEGAASVGVGKLTQSDVYLMKRRKSGKTVAALAASVGCCPWWFRQMELKNVDDTRLKEFWENPSFKAAPKKAAPKKSKKSKKKVSAKKTKSKGKKKVSGKKKSKKTTKKKTKTKNRK